MEQDPRSKSPQPARPRNPTHFGGDGLYDQSHAAQAEGASRAERRATSTFDYVKRNPLPLLALAGLIWLLATLVRRSTQG